MYEKNLFSTKLELHGELYDSGARGNQCKNVTFRRGINFLTCILLIQAYTV